MRKEKKKDRKVGAVRPGTTDKIGLRTKPAKVIPSVSSQLLPSFSFLNSG